MPVRRKSPTLVRRCGPVRLYLDDLIELDAIVRRVSPDASLEANGGYELDAVEELTDVPGGTIRSLKWLGRVGTSFTSYLSVDLSSPRPTIAAHHYDDALRGAAEDLTDVLRRSRRRLGPLTWHVAIRTLLVLVISALGFWLPESWTEWWWLYPLLGVALLVGFGGSWVDLRPVTFVPYRRAEHPSFWRRKGDDIKLLVVGVVLGAIPTGIITYLTAK